MPTPDSSHSENRAGLSRGSFLRQGFGGLAAVAVLSAVSSRSAGAVDEEKTVVSKSRCDLREFIHWVLAEFEPTIHLPGGAGHYARTPGQSAMELYGVSDMACILYTLGQLHPTESERAEWRAAFQVFQNPDTGWLVEKDPTHAPLHNTAFALAAMQLLDLAPAQPVKIGQEYADARAFLTSLDWRKAVYAESHKGAGIGAIYALVPDLYTTKWFDEYFQTCDEFFDPTNGLMGKGKPSGGDFDQIGGTFHYNFLYSYFNRQMPFPERRIDSVLGLQQKDQYWHPENHLWLTLDAVYLLTRSLRISPYRFVDVKNCLRRLVPILQRDIFSAEGRRKIFTGKLAVHSLTAALSIAAELQQFLGADEIITDKPLKLVLDRRPFI